MRYYFDPNAFGYNDSADDFDPTNADVLMLSEEQKKKITIHSMIIFLRKN